MIGAAVKLVLNFRVRMLLKGTESREKHSPFTPQSWKLENIISLFKVFENRKYCESTAQ